MKCERLIAVVRIFLLISGVGNCSAAVIQEDFSQIPVRWSAFGDSSLFGWNSGEKTLDATWDSSKPNSYFYLPLGRKITTGESFSFGFTVEFKDIEIGRNPLKPYTFELAIGLVNLATATREGFWRGSGINAEHGPRNLLEFAYFPDSGFGATVAPTAASSENKVVFSDNHPLELRPGAVYTVSMSYDTALRTVTTVMWRNGDSFGTGPGNTIKTLQLPPSFTDFDLDAFAISSYSDEGQSPPQFAGSLLAHGRVDNIEIMLPDGPALAIARGGDQMELMFRTDEQNDYHIEHLADLIAWTEEKVLGGTGTEVRVPFDSEREHTFYRLRVTRKQ